MDGARFQVQKRSDADVRVWCTVLRALGESNRRIMAERHFIHAFRS